MDEEQFLLPSAVNDPFIEEVPAHKKSHWAACIFNVVATTVGAGVVSLPGAIKLNGYFGLIVIAFTAVCANYAAKLIIECMDAIPGRTLHTYADIGEAAFETIGYPKVGKTMALVLQLFTLFGVCTIFLILAGGNLHALVPHFGTHVWVLIVGAGLIPFAWLKTMKEISFLALFGVLASFFAAGVIIVKGFVRDTADDQEFFIGGGLSQAFNIIVFSLGGTSVMPTIADNMRDRRQWPRVANISYVIIAGIYGLVGFAGYYGWGDGVAPNVLISMDQKKPIVKVALWFITAHVILAYPIPLNPINLYLEELFGFDKLSSVTELALRIPLRTTVVLSTMLLASIIPYFGDVLSLVSALSLISMVFVLPVLFYALLHREKMTPLRIVLFVIIFLLGCVGTVAGIYFGVKALKKDIQANPSPFDDYFSNKN